MGTQRRPADDGKRHVKDFGGNAARGHEHLSAHQIRLESAAKFDQFGSGRAQLIHIEPLIQRADHALLTIRFGRGDFSRR